MYFFSGSGSITYRFQKKNLIGTINIIILSCIVTTNFIGMLAMIKILVCGGRQYTNRKKIHQVLDALKQHYGDIYIISGAATGADMLVIKWSIANDVKYKAYPAEWTKYGKAAGPIRNQQMLDEEKPNIVVAFPGGKGTLDMVKRSMRSEIQVFNVLEDIDNAH